MTGAARVLCVLGGLAFLGAVTVIALWVVEDRDGWEDDETLP